MINAKFLEEKIKRGWTIEDFCTHFDMNKDDFEKYLDRFLTAKAVRHYKAEISKNSKLPKKKSKPLALSIFEPYATSSEPSKINYSDSESISEIDENNASETSSQEEILSLDALRIREKELLEKLSSLELEHKTYVSARIQAQNEIRALKQELEEIQKRVQQCRTSLSEKLQNFRQKGQEMATVNSAISEVRSSLEEVQGQISKCLTFSVYVYNSDLSFESAFEVEIPDEWESIFDGIKDRDDLDTFTGRQLKNLSKAVAIKNKYECNAQFIFESPELEKIFDSLI